MCYYKKLGIITRNSYTARLYMCLSTCQIYRYVIYVSLYTGVTSNLLLRLRSKKTLVSMGGYLK